MTLVNFTKAIYDRMALDTELTSLIETHKGQPAIFTAEPIPTTAKLPHIVTTGPVAHTFFDTKTENGHDYMRDIFIWAKNEGSTDEVETIAERVKNLFHRKPLTILSFSNILCLVTNVAAAPTDHRILGRVVTIKITGLECN